MTNTADLMARAQAGHGSGGVRGADLAVSSRASSALLSGSSDLSKTPKMLCRTRFSLLGKDSSGSKRSYVSLRASLYRIATDRCLDGRRSASPTPGRAVEHAACRRPPEPTGSARWSSLGR